MARALRIEYPGAIYHVINRGNQRQRVFHGVRYYRLFVEKMVKFSEIYEVRIRAYCLMSNHFHLYLQTSQPNLGRFMQSFLTSYCIVANRWRKSAGHIFQGRFKAHLIQDELYGSRVSRYIHLNPVHLNTLKESSVEERLQLLHEFQWSSFHALAGLRPMPKWLDAKASLCRWGKTKPEQCRNYREYVEEGLGIKVESPFEEVVAQSILGDEQFVNQVTRSELLDRDIDGREEPALRKLQTGLLPDDILHAVAEEFKVDIRKIIQRRDNHRLARRIAIFCVSEFCRSRFSQTELATYFGLKLSGFGTAGRKVEQALIETPELRDKADSIKQKLIEFTIKTEV